MVAYHLKRVFRNRFCVHFPGIYTRYINHFSRRVPPLADFNKFRSDSRRLELAELVLNYYQEEYAPNLDAIADGTFSFFGQRVNFGEPQYIDWHHTVDAELDFHLWRQKLAHMGFIGPMLLSGTDTHIEGATAIVQSFRNYADFGRPGCFSSYWFPYSASHRVLNILSGYVLASQARSFPRDLRKALSDFLRWNVGFILCNIEHELRNNHVERNLAAICLYLCHTEPVPETLARRLDNDVEGYISACVLEDGMQVERSAMYQGLTVMALEIFASSNFLKESTRGLAASRLKRAKRAWALMTHPDGDIALFNDSWHGEVPRASHTQSDTFAPVSVLPDAGYVRLESDDYFVLFDAGEIGPRWNPGHGHADFLSMEVDVCGKRLIVDPGTFQYSTGERRQFERSAKSHNGPAREGVEPVSYSECFKVNKLASANLVDHSADNESGSATGELKIPSGRVQRHIRVSNSGISCEDKWYGVTLGAAVRLLIPDDWMVSSWDTHHALLVNGNLQVLINVREGKITALAATQWTSRYLHHNDAVSLMLVPTQSASSEVRLIWNLALQQN